MLTLLKRLFRREVEINLVTPMKPSEIALALRHCDDNPVWRAVHAILRDEIRRRMRSVTDPALAEKPGALTHEAGELNGLIALADHLNNVKERAEKDVVTELMAG